MRTKFYESLQGRRSVREYVRLLKSLAARLPDIMEFHINQQFWEGANAYLRQDWTKSGYSAEYSSLHDLEEAAERFEQAEILRVFEEKRAQLRKIERDRQVRGSASRRDHGSSNTGGGGLQK